MSDDIMLQIYVNITANIRLGEYTECILCHWTRGGFFFKLWNDKMEFQQTDQQNT